ncbi:MAG: SGNH/GDSL hydrolase family protein [Clostridia bacterium]|nr:SGNH/GDSL hydrolase family protein [Clostridia bacterium]
MLKKNSVLLFQGDSITDTCRTDAPDPSASLGKGYPAKIADKLASDYADLNIKVINRGISGNRTWDLIKRWDKECIDIQPDYISLLIGVNDTWRSFDSNDVTTADQYEENMRHLLDRIVNETSAKIILINIFLLDVMPDKVAMHPDLREKQEVISRLIKDYDVTYVDIQEIYDKMVAEGTPMEKLSEDGVHPTDFGHEVIAEEWLKAVINI